MSKRRSIRRYTKEPVAEKDIETLLHAALLAASSRSKRPWEIVTVKDRSKIESLAAVKARGSAFLRNAPLAFVIAGIPDESDVWIEDTSIVSTHLMLEAEALGLGACWIQIRNRYSPAGSPSEDAVRTLLGIPESRTVEAIIAVGHPDEKLAPYDKDQLRWDKVHREHYHLN